LRAGRDLLTSRRNRGGAIAVVQGEQNDMRNWLHPPLLRASAAVPTACGGGGSAPATLDGTWARSDTGAGGRTTITLSSQCGAVTGAGTFVGEGGVAGTLTVAGTWQGDRADLTLCFSDGAVGRFHGTLVGPGQLGGTMSFDGGATREAAFARP
jgi:hypothetical protein